MMPNQPIGFSKISTMARMSVEEYDKLSPEERQKYDKEEHAREAREQAGMVYISASYRFVCSFMA